MKATELIARLTSEDVDQSDYRILVETEYGYMEIKSVRVASMDKEPAVFQVVPYGPEKEAIVFELFPRYFLAKAKL